MAYAAVISLKHTIERLSNSSHISIVPPCQDIIEVAYKEVQSLRDILRKLDRSSRSDNSKRVNALDGQIKEAVCELEDALESHVSNQFLSQSESHPSSFSLDLQEVKQDIDSFTQTVKKLKEECIKELSNPLSEEEEDDDDAVPSRIGFVGNKSKMVGLSDELGKFIHLLADSSYGVRVRCVSLVGMAGIGKTTLAKEIFENQSISNHFDRRAFVTIGPKYQLKEILQSILAQVNPDIGVMPTEGDERLAGLKRMMYQSLKGRRYLIVFDDLWPDHTWPNLRRLFPDHKNGSRFLVTTRLERVAEFASNFLSTYKIRFLNKEESWHLLRGKVFDEESCPSQLEKAGKKIAENCEGLPLTIVTVANLLSKAEKTSEYWNKVAEKENSIFMDAYDEMSKVLLPSYKYLPQHLKACFLYMGVFPQNYEIPLSKLSMLWCAEGFFEPYMHDYIKFSGLVCLKELVSTSLVVVRKQSSSSGIKTCCLHSVFWHLCNREAEKNMFFHVLNSCADRSAEGIKSQRRFCIRKNILFDIKDVYNSMASISTARSLLCTGPPHQYPIPICFDRLRLLRLLDALTIGFHEFPIEVLKLVQLRYLALTFSNGNLPPSISKLWNLQFLIVCRHLSIKYSGAPSYLPMDIWDMQELKHLQIMGSNLPDPCGALLPNLFTLSDVSAHSCTKGVLERIPNLMKLGIRIELELDAVEPLSCFDHISHLHKLESLKCIVVNPKLKPEVVAPHPRLPIFSSGLNKLSLSGCGYPWEDMRVIASLPYLRVLKLRCYAFRGPKWKTYGMRFLFLEFLLIEDTDLVHWTVGDDSFPLLRRLILKQCYKLQEIPGAFGKSLEKIELIDCNPLAVTCAKQMEKESHALDVNVHSSY